MRAPESLRRKERIDNKRRGIYVDYIFDLETYNWDTFVLGGFFDNETNKSEMYGWQDGEQALYERIVACALEERFDEETGKARETTMWAHNGGRYDALWLCDWLVKRGAVAQVFASSARITLIKLGNLCIRDSAALVPMRLEDGAKLGKVAKSSTGLPCVCVKRCDAARAVGLKGWRWRRRARAPWARPARHRGRCALGSKCGKRCGGYCSIRRDMSPKDLANLSHYLDQDLRATASMLVCLEEACVKNDIDLRGTIGSSSWATARRRNDLPRAAWESPAEYKAARAGYYGGRVQVFRPRSKRGFRYDVNAAYIAALSSIQLPIGKPRKLGPGDAARAFEQGTAGIYSATVEVDPKTHIPPLPWRKPKENGKDGGRLYYPTGRVTGTWTRTELDYALSLGSVSVAHWGPSLAWAQSAAIMAPYASYTWALRDQAGKKSPLGKWYKWLGNSVTGKLAQRPDAEECVLAPANPKPCPGGLWCKRVNCGEGDRCCNHRCYRTCGRYDAIDHDGTVWTRPVWKIPDNGHVQWAAYLTAHARICLHKMLVADGDGGRSAVYCDTDSCYSETEREHTGLIGVGLGQWLREGTYRDFDALAPKTYSYFDEDGERQVRAKGMFDPDWATLVKKEPVAIDRGVIQFKTAAREGEGMFRRRDFSRTSHHDGVHFGDRLFDEGAGLTLPECMAPLTIAEAARGMLA